MDVLLDNVSVAAADECVAPPSGLVSWWRGEGDATDHAGTNSGTVSGGLLFTNGMVGKAFDFNGTNSQISFGNTIGNFGTNDFAVEFWMKTTSTRLEAILAKWPVCGHSSFFSLRL